MENLNLARKLRPKNFEEIIGQDLSVSMLKNSLFSKKIFPVYLFSGQRGCGKTSTARVFAAAINCTNLTKFQSDAKQNSVPCLTCNSCRSMQEANHPDFIEMDAASHTGVDSVRQIIESCTYMPLSGCKKIYLVDEAHMLSKAAFNAFLKILEEPPLSTIFILATTEIQKIPDTVRSRCFQVLFSPVKNDVLLTHVKQICTNEGIDAEEDAISLIIKETEGSVRDSINTLEQVRFSGEKITKDLVLKSLGKIGETRLYEIFNHILDQNQKGLLTTLKEIEFDSLSAQNIWHMVVQLLRNLLWTKYGVNNTNNESIEKFAKKCSVERLYALLQIMWSQEELFLQTPQKHVFLEIVLLTMSRQVNIIDLKELISQCSGGTIETGSWSSFVNELESTCNDPVLVSVFRQSNAKIKENGFISLEIGGQGQFLIEKIKETESMWKPIIIKHFDNFSSFVFLQAQTKAANATPSSQPIAPQKLETNRTQTLKGMPFKGTPFKGSPFTKSQGTTSGTKVDVSDKEKWPMANLLTEHFSGQVEKIPDTGDQNE
jgi:DNA polymerase III subunit gamma/tau